MNSLRAILGDARFALRLLARAPLFAATLLSVLVAGIGATTAMFSILQALLFRPLPYPEPEELTTIWKTYEPVSRSWPSSIPDYVDYRAMNTAFESISAIGWDSFSMTVGAEPAQHVAGSDVSGEFFAMMGIRPLQGRFVGLEDDRVGAPRVCVVSAKLWHERFGSDPGLVGRSVTLNGEPFTVVGIGPEGFRFGGPQAGRVDLWVPLTRAQHYADRAESRGDNSLQILGRRKQGVSLEAAQADLDAVTRQIKANHPQSWANRGLAAVSLHEALVGSAKKSVLVLFGAVALVFLVVCANVASLLLARNASRRAELAARAALGATRRRLVAQLVTESAVIFLLGGLGGVAVAHWLVDFFAASIVQQVWSANLVMKVDVVAGVAAVALALVSGVAFGLAPALATSRVEPQTVLKETAAQAGVSRSQRLVRSTLVVAQVAVAFALLVGSGLALRAFHRLATTPVGFQAEGLTIGRVTLQESKYGDDERNLRFYEAVFARLRAEPGVEGVTANASMPMSRSNSNGWFKVEGRPPPPPNSGPVMERNAVAPGYFKTMGIPLLRGRDFNDDDAAKGRQVAIISARVAAEVFPGEDPIGRRIDLMDRTDDDDWREIVGVVGDVRQTGLSRPIALEAYEPLAQHTPRWMAFGVRAQSSEAAAAHLREAVRGVDPEVAVFDIGKMEDKVDETIAEQRFLTLLLGAFALAALLLSTLGLFGLVSYTTSQRTRELGLRMALGSSPGAVVGLIVRGGVRLVGLGLVLGLLAALFVGQVLAAHLGGVRAYDPAIYALIPLVLGLTGLLSCAMPAWRAVRIPPSVALRYE